jgi:hypothetical protein
LINDKLELVEPPRELTQSRQPRENMPLRPARAARLRSLARDGWLFAAILVIGFALRAALISTVAGRIDSDEASIWLQALHMTRGEFSPFFWGNNYGGTGPQVVLAGLIKLFGPHLILMRITNLVYSAVGAVLLWDATRRVFGRYVADGAFGLYYLFPAFTFWWDTREYGHYAASITLAIFTVWVAVRLAARPRIVTAAGLGLLIGLCFWSYPLLAVIMMLPAALALISPAVRWRDRLAATLATPLGAAPWLVYNALNGWPSLNPIPSYPTIRVMPPQPRFLIRLHDVVTVLYPSGYTAGSGIVFDANVATVLGVLTFVGAAVLGLVFLLRRDWIRMALAGSILLWPVMNALFKVNASAAAYRYGMYLYPPLFVLAASLVVQRRQAVAVSIAALALSVAGVYELSGGFQPTGTYAHNPQIDALAQQLESSGSTKVYADYWIAYTLSAQSNEAVIADPIIPSYYESYRSIVGAASPTVVVVFADQPNDQALIHFARGPGQQAVRERSGDYAIYRFRSHMDLSQLPGLGIA